MTAFEPGEGFREVSGTAEQPDLVEYDNGLPIRLWVREEPVPALPTWTVIRYPSRGIDDEPSVHINTPAGWALVQGQSLQFNARGWQPRDGYEVLTAPKSQTLRDHEKHVARDAAGAVLERIAAQPWAREVDLQKLRDEFGVQS